MENSEDQNKGPITKIQNKTHNDEHLAWKYFTCGSNKPDPPLKNNLSEDQNKVPRSKTQNQTGGAPCLKELSPLKTTVGGQDPSKKPKNQIQNQTLTHTIRDDD